MSEILNSMNLNPIEEKIYLTLLSIGQLSISEIVNLTGLKLQEVEKSINNLQNKNLIFINPSILKKYSAIYPLVALAEKTKNSLNLINSLGNQIDLYSVEKAESLDKIVKNQKENLKQITSTSKEEIRLSTDSKSNLISIELDKLIEKIGRAHV